MLQPLLPKARCSLLYRGGLHTKTLTREGNVQDDKIAAARIRGGQGLLAKAAGCPRALLLARVCTDP